MAAVESRKLFVGCLPFAQSEEDVRQVFEQFGILEEAVVLRGPDGKSKGAAVVTFFDASQAFQALETMQGFLFPGASRGLNISLKSGGRGTGPAGNTLAPGHVPQFVPPPNQPPPPACPPPPNHGRRVGFPPQHFAMPQMQHMQLGHAWVPAVPPQATFSVPRGAESGVPKLFIGQLPFSKTENDLKQLFSGIGPLVDVCLLKNASGMKTGAAFVRYVQLHDAFTAIAVLNGFMFPGATRPITVAFAKGNEALNEAASAVALGDMTANALANYSRGSSKRDYRTIEAQNQHAAMASSNGGYDGTKIFVGQLPYSRSEEDLMHVFSHFGSILEIILLKTPQGEKKGAAFVIFAEPASATEALKMDGYTFPGSPRPIGVSLANSKRQRTS